LRTRGRLRRRKAMPSLYPASMHAELTCPGRRQAVISSPSIRPGR
jgi:hypothetical protein